MSKQIKSCWYENAVTIFKIHLCKHFLFIHPLGYVITDNDSVKQLLQQVPIFWQTLSFHLPFPMLPGLLLHKKMFLVFVGVKLMLSFHTVWCAVDDEAKSHQALLHLYTLSIIFVPTFFLAKTNVWLTVEQKIGLGGKYLTFLWPFIFHNLYL